MAEKLDSVVTTLTLPPEVRQRPGKQETLRGALPGSASRRCSLRQLADCPHSRWGSWGGSVGQWCAGLRSGAG